MDMNQIVVLVIAVIVGMSLLGGIIANMTNLVSTPTIRDQPISLVLGAGCKLYTTYDNFVSNSSVSLANANGTLAEGTDYVICSGTGGLLSAITADSQGATNANYTYYPDEYIDNSMTRGIINLFPFGFVLALIMAGFVVAGIFR